jgi:hypothetical protein
MSAHDSLSTYLDDHLAGATAGVELAHRVVSSHEGRAEADVLRTVAAEIAEDREALIALRDGLGVQPSRWKAAAGWVGEKLTRAKLSDPVTGDADLTRLLQLETLSLGIAGKLALWQSLTSSMAGEPTAVDLDGLIRRAEQQRGVVEQCRLTAARAALTE